MQSLYGDLPLFEYEAVELEQLRLLAYADRIDTKYVFGIDLLPELFHSLITGYRMLQINGERVHPYKTVYFDTPRFDLYREHHKGRLERFKIRSRQYGLTGEVFNEVKRKTNKGRTIKTRIRRDSLDEFVDEMFSGFVEQIWPENPGPFIHSLDVYFNRMTLVDRAFTERVTIDTGLSYSFRGKSISLPGLTIAEVKKERHGSRSAASKLFRGNHMNCSKYCLGVAQLVPGVKVNRFKPMLRFIERIGSQRVP